ncbi:MAG: Clp protease [Harvfovirus sp.]|uniref:Clp protease n=1 Tax=Harvfovirus sp. TaxID=2487768 RepID=A0A3G5A3S2_9VIRU|nr:MAG: Clp protease [Harvfovirus sp.]
MKAKLFLACLCLCLGFAVASVSAKEVDINVNKADGDGLVRLTPDNFIVIRGHIDGMTASKTISEMMTHQNDKELYIYISSPGGYVTSGLEIIRMMESLTLNGVEVKCIADTALSMGFVIFQYCPVRYVTSSSILMQHQLSTGLRGPINQVVNYLEFVKSMEETVDAAQANRLGMTVSDFLAKTGDDWWLFGSSAVKYKAADSVANVLCDFEPGFVTKVFHTFFGDIEATYSNCPMARDPVKISMNGTVLPLHMTLEAAVKQNIYGNSNEHLDYSYDKDAHGARYKE